MKLQESQLHSGLRGIRIIVRIERDSLLARFARRLLDVRVSAIVVRFERESFIARFARRLLDVRVEALILHFARRPLIAHLRAAAAMFPLEAAAD
jgi:hypothetical protein